jgi:flagellin-like protein
VGNGTVARSGGGEHMHDTNTLDERAVTPVVGIVLLVAITVLLAGTAAAFFFGITDQTAEAEQPTAAFEFEDDVGGGSDTVTVKHVSGQPVLAVNLYIKVEGATCSSGGGSPDGRYNVADDFNLGADEMGAGMTVQVGTDLDFDGTRDLCPSGGDLDLSDATVTVLWENSEGASGTYESWTADE